MSENRAITKGRIEDICGLFGYRHELRKGKNFATIDGKIAETRFRYDGSLSPGRHLFMNQARRADSKFPAAYP